MGYSDDLEEPAEEARVEQTVDIVYSANAARGSRRYVWMAVGCSVVLCAVIIGAVVAVMGGGSNSDKSSSSMKEPAGAVPTAAPTRASDKLTEAPTTEFQSILSTMSRTEGAEFDDEVSYQSKALTWVLENNPAVSSSNNNKTMSHFDRQIQRYALACLYYATNQVANAYTDHAFGGFGLVPWNNEEGWLVLEDECQWFGLGCNPEGYVNWIDLETNAMTGSLPHELSYLGKSLRVLRLDKNFFHNKGDEGHDFLSNLKLLTNFSAQDTFLQYRGLPPQLGSLSLLESLDLSYVVYIGEISNDIFAGKDNPLPNLLYLDISGNSFHAPLPRSISQLPALKAFYAVDSDLKGDTQFLTDMKTAQEVWLDDNPQLTGDLPPTIDAMSKLKSFSVTNCDLTGPIPAALGNIPDLQQVWLYHNRLKGNIPSELGRLDKLQTLEIGGNELMGEMPDEICTMTIRGKLRELHADCPSPVVCECCDCCGPDCSRGKNNGGSGGGRKKRWL